MTFRPAAIAILAAGLAAASLGARPAQAYGPWQRTISYQGKQDLFYNFYEGPDPSGTATAMYISPVPVPAYVGHTYVPYQPLMPHEMMYKHTMTHYAYTPGAGWSRAKVRYGTGGLWLDHWLWELKEGCPDCH